MHTGDYPALGTSAAVDVDRTADGRAAVHDRFNEAATVLGRKWQLVILYRLTVSGPLGFGELRREIGGISSKVLSDCLAELSSWELVDRRVVSDRPLRVEYSLTERGRLFHPIIATIRDEFAFDGPDSGTQPDR